MFVRDVVIQTNHNIFPFPNRELEANPKPIESASSTHSYLDTCDCALFCAPSR
jgi:hypothetical protein